MIEGIFNHLREVKSKKKGRPLPSSVDEMSKFIVSFCIDFINTVTWQGSGPDGLVGPENNEKSIKSVREIFSETVNSKVCSRRNSLIPPANESRPLKRKTCSPPSKGKWTRREGGMRGER